MATENKKYIPALRFPEFQNDGEWKEYPLGQIFSRITKRNSVNNQNVLTISAQYGLISQYDYFNKNVAAIDVSNYYHISKYDFAYNKSKSQGYPYGAIKPLKLYEDGVVSPLYICFRIKDDRSFVNTFFEYYFESGLIHKEIDKISQEGARNHGLLNISTKDFFDKIILYIPSFLEQKKIADCLSSLDKYIDATKRKLELLKEHKKGLMQRLFPAKGKTTPELRFPEFQNDGEWKIVLLKDFTERLKSKVGNARLRPVSISAGIGFVDQKNKFGRDISGNQYSNYIELKKGEFAYNKGNSIKYPQGCVYQLKEFDIVACPNVFVCFRIINNDVYPDFISAYFASNYHGKQLQQHITSGVRSNGLLNISAETFLGIRIPLPSVSEQKKIAECLSSLDKYIDETSCKLEQLKGHKNGLMQQLFPKL